MKTLYVLEETTVGALSPKMVMNCSPTLQRKDVPGLWESYRPEDTYNLILEKQITDQEWYDLKDLIKNYKLFPKKSALQYNFKALPIVQNFFNPIKQVQRIKAQQINAQQISLQNVFNNVPKNCRVVLVDTKTNTKIGLYTTLTKGGKALGYCPSYCSDQKNNYSNREIVSRLDPNVIGYIR